MVSPRLKLTFAVSGIYGSFLYWGYLQERITSVKYEAADGSIGKWDYPFFLNLLMTVAAFITGFAMVKAMSQPTRPPLSHFWKPALSNTLASPFGYASLAYINYPLLLLAKSCKLVPVMVMGFLVSGKRYTRAEYLSVGLITAGVALFSYKPGGGGHGKHAEVERGALMEALGLGLVLVNLMLDGFTNAQQDLINKTHPSFYMMYRVNEAAVGFHLLLLLGGVGVLGANSELLLAVKFCAQFPAVLPDLLAFSLCAATGQVFIFWIIKEWGSLVNVTVTITRKFFSILLSVALFAHPVEWWQWVGIVSVFAGLMYQPLERALRGRSKRAADVEITHNGTGAAGGANGAATKKLN
ncbi:UDP-Glc/Gal endoplasmic reticulum nucleotide sugar transporter [Tribonema minus]|uniref:UDP-Glc/Gal endoplasmic reticulum nucleotide sugar transporter n=1 Tax=Tribonema minus TaxID=303371 RepID=A0A835ZGA1_9STRA|nr:UDP-Glc/Gal endoplasmic reticulum nucleotide sugar transporter [Tribonema minus]